MKALQGCMTTVGVLVCVAVGSVVLCVMVGASTRPRITHGGAVVAADPGPEDLVLKPGWRVAYDAAGLCHVRGEVVNKTGREVGYAQISFSGKDSSGAQVGTALANTNNLESGGRWKFDALFFGSEGIRTVEMKDLTGF